MNHLDFIVWCLRVTLDMKSIARTIVIGIRWGMFVDRFAGRHCNTKEKPITMKSFGG